MLILPLDSDDAIVLLDALNAFAAEQESRDDLAGYGQTAIRLAERIRELRPLVLTAADEQLKALGLGRYYRRPQG